MAENTKIEWCHHTFNPWRGCTKVSPGCKNCYAETMSGRNPKVLGEWGPNGTRVVAAEAQWREPQKWDRMAREGVCPHCHGKSTRDTPGKCPVCDGKGNIGPYRARVFCASLADVFENWRGRMTGSDGHPLIRVGLDTLTVPHSGARWKSIATVEQFHESDLLTMQDVRERLFQLIDDTPNLDWLLLTKRPENVIGYSPYAWALAGGTFPPNVWLGTSVENQEAADERIPHLLRVPAAVRFLSCEPLLGLVDLKRWLWAFDAAASSDIGAQIETPTGELHWAIVGGESGPGARPMNIEWARSLVQQCKAAGVACFVKQLGANAIRDARPTFAVTQRIPLESAKGGDPEEWPADLRVRQFPTPGAKAGAA